MSEPIEPDDTEELARVAYAQLGHYGVPFDRRSTHDLEKYRMIGNAVARAVCPPGFAVVNKDDLLTALSAWKNDGRMPREVYDRLRAKLA